MSESSRERMQTVAEEYANQSFPDGCQCEDEDDEICDWCAEVEEYYTDRCHRPYIRSNHENLHCLR